MKEKMKKNEANDIATLYFVFLSIVDSFIVASYVCVLFLVIFSI